MSLAGILPTRLFGVSASLVQGQVDQLEDRYLGMVEASGSNPDLSIFGRFMSAEVLVFPKSGHIFLVIMKRSAWHTR